MSDQNKKAELHPVSSGQYSWEDAYNEVTDRFDNRKIRVTCPNCNRESSPLCSKHTVVIKSGSRWVGLDHKEPYTEHETRCRKCGVRYRFTTFSPQ